MCSGTEAPMLAQRAWAGAMRKLYNRPAPYTHAFACEREAKKQQFLMEMMSGDSCMERLYADALELGGTAQTALE
eukprot:14561081-Alexandrium_andersonii.AAC.1